MAPAFFDSSGSQDGAWILFFLVSLCARLFGRNFIFRYLRLPIITGYMIIGAIFGPYILGVMDEKQVFELKYVTQAALGFIAVSAGAEIYIPEIRTLLVAIGWISCGVVFFTMLLVTLFMFGVGGTPFLPWLNAEASCKFGVSMFAGVVACIRAPSAVLAVIREMKAKGDLTATSIGVTVLGDVMALVLFAITMGMTSNFCSGEAFDVPTFLVNIVMILVAIVWGAIVGLLVIQIMRIQYAKYLILPIGLLCFMTSDYILATSKISTAYELRIDALLVCIVAGFVVGNSPMRKELISYLASLTRYVFIPFFASVGLQLNLPVLIETIGFAVVLAFVRALAMFLGTLSGGVWVGLERDRAGMLWMGLIPQAGVALGLTGIVAQTYKDTWGKDFQSTIVGAILFNQVVGPMLGKYFLSWAGEAGKGEEGESNGFKQTIAAAELNDGRNIGDPEYVEFETQTEDHLFLMAERGELVLTDDEEDDEDSDDPITDMEGGSAKGAAVAQTEPVSSLTGRVRGYRQSPLRILVPRPPQPPPTADAHGPQSGHYAALEVTTASDRGSDACSVSASDNASDNGGSRTPEEA